MINTCKDCENRHTACHDTCRKYLDAKAKHDMAIKRKTKEDIVSGVFAALTVERRKKWQK